MKYRQNVQMWSKRGMEAQVAVFVTNKDILRTPGRSAERPPHGGQRGGGCASTTAEMGGNCMALAVRNDARRAGPSRCQRLTGAVPVAALRCGSWTGEPAGGVPAAPGCAAEVRLMSDRVWAGYVGMLAVPSACAAYVPHEPPGPRRCSRRSAAGCWGWCPGHRRRLSLAAASRPTGAPRVFAASGATPRSVRLRTRRCGNRLCISAPGSCSVLPRMHPNCRSPIGSTPSPAIGPAVNGPGSAGSAQATCHDRRRAALASQDGQLPPAP